MSAVRAINKWMRLGAASRFLGVDPSTLRAWTDAGRIPAFRTPGGHRRYAERDLRSFLARHQGRHESMAEIIGPHGTRLIDGGARQLARSQDWYRAVDPNAAAAMRSSCRRLMEGLAGYVAGGSRQTASLRAGERAGRALGVHVATAGMTPSVATRAFLFFRKMVIDMAAGRLPLSPDRKVQSLQRIDAYLNQVLLEMMSAYEARKDRRRGRVEAR